MSKLDASIAALRADGDGDHSQIAATTRSRVHKSLTRRAKSRRRLVQSSLIASVLLVSTFSWAWSTGRISFRSAPEPVLSPAPEPVVVPPAPKPRVRSAPEPTFPPAVVAPEPPLAPIVVEKAKPPRPATAATPTAGRPPATIILTPTEQLYRKAHELHFRGTDPAGALAAWDTYLAAEASGRFAIEARYNRGLLLARLGRYVEARAALAPYSAGEVSNGYRRAEARAIIERLDQIASVNDAPVSGD